MEKYLILGTVNLALLVVLLVYVLRRPVRAYLQARSTKLKERRQEVWAAYEDIKRNYDFCSSRLGNINQEMNEIFKKAETEGNLEGQRILREIEMAVDRIIEQSMERAANEVRKKNMECYAEMVDKSISMAGKAISRKMTRGGQIQFCKNFLRRLQADI